ncbi:MFS transporter [Actibacterium sp. MT2.3-13A]|uniref:MFS transporter n=1 Tax=Actibacterium sp. MT2.3-13A TaxID=2828332 RepID=UPI001BAD64EA|nr:MFS transporter [Actibacterium sp. MT2.3-13A]
MGFILLTLVIDAMGIGLIVPVLPGLIRDVTGGTLADAALWGGVLSTAFAVMQFLFGPLTGNLSDRYGRRPVLLISMAVMAADYLVMALAGSIWWLLAGRVVGGISAATQSTATAFVADISAPAEKSARFGLVGAAFGLGFVLGPALGGLLGQLGPRAPFYAAALLAGANFALGLAVLPETVNDRTRRRFRLSRANPLGALRQMRALPGLGRLFVLVFLYDFAFIVYPATWAFFTQARFGWAPAMVGLSLAAFGLSSAAVQGWLIRPVLASFGERRTVLAGLGFSLLAFAILSGIGDGALALGLIPLAALGFMATPALQGMMSQRVGDDAQGALQGAVTSTKALAAILSPLVMTATFSAFTAPGAPLQLPGAPFLLAALLMLVCAVVFAAEPAAQDAR